MSGTATRVLGVAFLASGGVALLCAPGILIAERFGWPEKPLHVTQLLAVIVGFPTSVAYLIASRRAGRNGPSAPAWSLRLAWTAALLTGVWLSFFVLLVTTLDFGGGSREGRELMRNQADLRRRGEAIIEQIERFAEQHGHFPASLEELVPEPVTGGLLETGVDGRDWEYRSSRNRGFWLAIGNGEFSSDGFCLSYDSRSGTWYSDY